jgi:hypothetical protein
MKNITSLLILSLLFLGCSQKSISDKDIIGSWLDQSEAQLHFTLLENGKARSDNMKTLIYQKWELRNDSLILTIKSEGNGNSSIDKMAFKIEMPSSNKMILSNTYSSNDYLKK